MLPFEASERFIESCETNRFGEPRSVPKCCVVGNTGPGAKDTGGDLNDN